MKSGFPWLYLCFSGSLAFAGCAHSEGNRSELYDTDQGGQAGATPGKGGAQAAGTSSAGGRSGGPGAAGAGGSAEPGGSAGAAGEAGAGGDSGGAGGDSGASAAGKAGSAAGGPVALPCNNKLLLNELQAIDDKGDEKFEFVEILNAGPDACTVSLAGWTLESDGTVLFTGEAKSNIKNGKRYVLAGQTFVAPPPFGVDLGLGDLSIFPAAGACVQLRYKNKTVDEVCYGGNGAPAPPPSKSIGRSPDGVDTDDDKVDWLVLDTASPRAKN